MNGLTRKTMGNAIVLSMLSTSFTGLLALMSSDAGALRVDAGTSWYDVGHRPTAVFLSDVDNDTDLDVLCANIDYSITVMTNDGSGDFRDKEDFAFPRSQCFDVGDLTGDGLPDIASVGSDVNPHNTFVLLNDGTGGFGNMVEYKRDMDDRVDTIKLGDMDGDGDLDIVLSHGDGFIIDDAISVQKNDGTGNFTNATEYTISATPIGLDVGDIDGDDDLDVVTANSNDTAIVLLNNGTGGLGNATVYETGDMNAGWNSNGLLRLSDLDMDGNLDIVTVNNDDDTISVLLGNGNGTFQEATDYSAGRGPDSVFIGDVDDDGDPDLVLSGKSTVSLLWNNGIGEFASMMEYRVTLAETDYNSPLSITLGDVDGDDAPDIITAYSSAGSGDADNTVLVLHNNGNGWFGSARDHSVGDTPLDVETGDVDGDEDLDIVTANRDNDTVSILENNGAGGFGPEKNFTVDSNPYMVRMGYLDDDDNLDIVTANDGGDSLTVLLGDGDGDFSDRRDYSLDDMPRSLVLGDVNDDGYVDIVTSYSMDTISVLRNDGDGDFTVDWTNTSVPDTPGTADLGDVNGDGHPDLVSADIVLSHRRIYVFTNDGSGIFGNQINYTVGVNPCSVHLGDVDMDGDLDIVTANRESDTISVVKNDGTGIFGASSHYLVGDSPESVDLGDVDGDGDLDVLTVNRKDDSVTILRNSGVGAYGTRTDYPVGPEPFSARLSDMDRDMDLDIVSASEDESTVSVILNHDNDDHMLDTDGDGFPDFSDAFPENNLEWIDSDRDGFGDNVDDIPWDPFEYVDADGDYHGDTFSDAFPEDDTQWSDRDGDGFGDNRPGTNITIRGVLIKVEYGDLFPDNPLEWMDNDGDGIGDNSDYDDDNDWYDDVVELDEGSDPLDAGDTPDDLDSDGIPDSTDEDKDNDGYPNFQDAFPTDPLEYVDTDGDGDGDNGDTDDDTDNWPAHGADGQPGVAGVDDDGNGNTDDDWEEGWEGSDDDMFPLEIGRAHVRDPVALIGIVCRHRV